MDVIRLTLPDGDNLEFQIALVDEPAIESNFMAFNKQNHFQFKEVDKSERKLMGYFMIADLEILRIDQKRGAYKVVFDKKSIDKIVENFSFNGLNRNMNEMHQTGKLSDGVYVLNQWQIDSAKGIKAPEGFKTEADGSWFGIVKCNNEEIYQKALNGTFNGFSIEGKFIEEAIDKYFKTDIDQFLNSVESANPKTKSLYNKFKNMELNLKEAFDAFVAYFSKEDTAVAQKFEELMLVDGETKVMIEPAVEVGAAIALFDSEGTPIPAPVNLEGYELADGRKLIVEVEGVIASVTEAEVEGEEMGDDKSASSAPAENAAVKRLIERIEKVSEFEKQIAELKEENAKAKTESDFLHKENDELKSQFAELKQFTKETLETIKGLVAAEEAKAPVTPARQGFKMEKKDNGISQYFKK
jgi:microcompartment protein CcmL/EutN